jgi:RNA polymerase sigma factor (TIGR02999 family)
MSKLARILEGIERGEVKTAEELLPVVYEELRRLAARQMYGEAAGHTLQPTALVHEAWLRLGDSARFENRAHFFGAAAEAMRRILIDGARRKRALRHGGGQDRIDLSDIHIAAPTADDELLAVHDALENFAQREPFKAELVKLRYFVGLTIEKTAQVLNISSGTAKRHWTYARAWLYDEIRRGTAG